MEQKHIFFTGDIQVGKSTILQKYLVAHPEWTVGGFRTVWLEERSAERNSFYIVPAAQDVPLTEQNRVGIREGKWPDRICTDFPDIYDTLGVALLKDAENCDIILMDEIGLAENEAALFQRTVLSVLDGDTPVIGVVQAKAGVLTDTVREHPKVETIVVTLENRNDVLQKMLL